MCFLWAVTQAREQEATSQRGHLYFAGTACPVDRQEVQGRVGSTIGPVWWGGCMVAKMQDGQD